MERLVIAIDGPAGAGKTTIAKKLASKLGIEFFSTGSLYRALAYKCVQNNLDATSDDVAIKIANSTKINVDYQNGTQHVILDNIDVTDKLSTENVSEGASQISVHKCIREKLVNIQREVARDFDIIMDGRDIGSVVLPYAKYKFYLDATPEIRAERRYHELLEKGQSVNYQTILDDIKDRDYRDKTRAISPLIKCKDSIIVDSTNLTIDQVVETFYNIITNKGE